MRILNGMHGPNYRMWHIEQMLRAAPGAVTFLHTQLFDDPTLPAWGDRENEFWYLKLREGYAPQGIPPAPDRLIHIRMYHPNWTTITPIQWAEHTVELLSNWKGSGISEGQRHDLFGDPFVCISPANEQNIEPGPWRPEYQTVAWYDRIGQWALAWQTRIDQLRPDRKALLVTPALADGHEPFDTKPSGQSYRPDEEYTLPAIRDMLHAYDLVGIHPYAIAHENPESLPDGRLAYWYMLRPFRPVQWETERDLGGVISQYPNLSYLITETGTFRHSDKRYTVETVRAFNNLYGAAVSSGRVVGVTPFIWSTDDAHPQNNINPNDQLRDALEELPAYVSQVNLPVRGPKPPKPPRPPMFNANPYDYLVGDGFVKKATELKWVLLSDEIYRDPAGPTDSRRPPFSEVFCDKGRLYYHAKTGVIAVPFVIPEL